MTVSLWLVMSAAVLASLAAGVLLAYTCCIAMFRAFRIHTRQIQAQRQSVESTVLASHP